MTSMLPPPETTTTTCAESGGQQSLREKIARQESGILLFSITPPRIATPEAKRQEIADATIHRLADIDVDGLILYDLDDESDRNPQQRPFPYLETLDPALFYQNYLQAWTKPVVVYRCVGKYSDQQLKEWLADCDPKTTLTVFVGSSSRTKAVNIKLPHAQALWLREQPELSLGGVMITERHKASDSEHLRMIAKEQQGVSFFVTQVVYDVDATKNLLSDYYYTSKAAQQPMRPIIFTLSVCGSLKTMEFLEWLGVELPQWFKNDLMHADDTLAESYAQCLSNANDLITFCLRRGIPFGFNIESVSVRKVEIEATVSLAKAIATLLTNRLAGSDQ